MYQVSCLQYFVFLHVHTLLTLSVITALNALVAYVNSYWNKTKPYIYIYFFQWCWCHAGLGTKRTYFLCKLTHILLYAFINLMFNIFKRLL